MWKNIIYTLQRRVSNSRGHSRYILWKDLWRIRTRITQIKEIVHTSKLHVNKGGSAKLCNKLSFKQKQTLRTRNNHIPSYSCRTDCFKYSIFLPTLNDWFNLNEIITNSESILIFKSKLLYFICQVQSNIYIQYFSPKRA